MLLNSDEIRLRHMIQAGKEAVGYIQKHQRADIDTNRPLLHSLVRCIEIMGEAASRVSQDFRSKHPEVPWREIVGMRNRLIHSYHDINHDILWKTASEEIPHLLLLLEKILDTFENP